MAANFGDFFKQITTGDEVRDYQHAARTFVDSLYRLGPKFNSLFHVFIDVDPRVGSALSNNVSVLSKYISKEDLIEIGLMAKTVSLPKFSVQTKVYNAYNRKNIAQERINYEPVSMTFHDDSANKVREFWQRYYSFHYRDTDYTEATFSANHKYEPRQQSAWGFSPLIANGEGHINYIKAIRIYSLHQKSFSSYTILNPIIKEFQHGDHVQGEYGLLEHGMTVEYESVLYASGPVNSEQVMGWNEIHYDNTPSPLSGLGGGTRSIIGEGGIVDSALEAAQNGDLLGAGLTLARGARNWENADIKSVAASEFFQLSKNILRGQNTTSSVFAPTRSSITNALSKATTSRR